MGGGLQQKRRRKEARSVHVPTEEKAEVNQQVLRELGAWISFLGGAPWSPSAQTQKDPLFKTLTELGNPDLQPFLNGEVGRVDLVLGPTDPLRARVKKLLEKKGTFLEAHWGEEGLTLINPYVIPTSLELEDDPVYLELSALGDVAVAFLSDKQGSLLLPLPDSELERELMVETLSQPSYFVVRYLDANTIEITNPYFVSSKLKQKEGALSKELRGILEEIRDSKSPSAILAANGCIGELIGYLSDRDLQLQRAESGPVWLAESYKKMAHLQTLRAENILARLKYIQKQVRKGSTQKLVIPAKLEADKKRLAKKFSKAQEALLENLTGKSAIKKIERGIKMGLYSQLEVAFYEHTKETLLHLLRDFNISEREGLIKLSDVERLNIARAYEYVNALETMAWKVEYHEAKKTLEEITSTKPSREDAKHVGNGIFRRDVVVPPGYSGEKEVLAETRSLSSAYRGVAGAPRNRNLYALSVEEQSSLLLEGPKSLRGRMMLASKKAPEHFAMLEQFVEHYIEGDAFHLSSTDTKPYIAQFRQLRKEAEALQGAVAKMPTRAQFEAKMRKMESTFDDPFSLLAAQRRYIEKTFSQAYEGFSAEYDDIIGRSAEESQSLLTLINTREREQVLINEELSVPTRIGAAFDLLILNNAVPIMVGSGVVGGVIGGVGGGVSTGGGGVVPGAAAGAKFGWGVGCLIVAAAGAFNSADALVDYINAKNERDEQKALGRARGSAYYMGFGIGGGPITGTAGKIVSATAFGGLAVSNSAFLYEDIRAAAAGDNSAYMKIPTDIAFIAIGSVGFFKTMRGFWKPVRLPNYMQQEITSKSLLVGSFGIAEQQLGVQLPRILSRAVSAGYSPGFVVLNSGFATLSALPDLEDAVSRGKYRQAFDVFSRGFTHMSSSMITFEFALAGAGAGFKVLRRFSPQMARRVRFLQLDGLHSRISEFADAGGANLKDPATQKKLIEIAFGSKGKFSREQIQALLGLEGKAGEEAAKAIAKDTSESWALAIDAFPITGGTAPAKKLKEVWGKAAKHFEEERARQVSALRWLRSGGRAGSALTVPALIGVSSWSEYKTKKQQKLAKAFSKVLTPLETDFLSVLSSQDKDIRKFLAPFGLSQLKHLEVLKAFDWINSRDYPELSEKQILREKRLRIASAVALMANGEDASFKETEFLAESIRRALEQIGLDADDNPPLDVSILAASIINAQGVEQFVDNYEAILFRLKENDVLHKFSEHDLFVYSIGSLYAASALGEGVPWATERSIMLLDDTLTYSEGQRDFIRGGPLLWLLSETKDDISGFSEAMQKILQTHRLYVMQPGEAIMGEILTDALTSGIVKNNQ